MRLSHGDADKSLSRMTTSRWKGWEGVQDQGAPELWLHSGLLSGGVVGVKLSMTYIMLIKLLAVKNISWRCTS